MPDNYQNKETKGYLPVNQLHFDNGRAPIELQTYNGLTFNLYFVKLVGIFVSKSAQDWKYFIEGGSA